MRGEISSVSGMNGSDGSSKVRENETPRFRRAERRGVPLIFGFVRRLRFVPNEELIFAGGVEQIRIASARASPELLWRSVDWWGEGANRDKEKRNMGREREVPKQRQVAYTVKQLVAVNRYTPDILPDLENYVSEQVSSQTYSLDANLCLLRLYQFEPERMSSQIVARILVKALMAMPASDFSLCLFLIPERVQVEEQFKTLIVLSHYLETGRFRQSWDEAAKSRNIVEAVPGDVAETEINFRI